MKERRKDFFKNPISYFGLVIFLSFLVITILSFFWGIFAGGSNPYVGILTFIVFPFLSLIGIFFVFLGTLIEGKRRKEKMGESFPYPVLDLNNERHRKNFAIGFVVFLLLCSLFVVLGYNAFNFTESVAFCGKICHKVMQPEYSAYLNSPHAKVTCVECHVGKGVSWYVKSKLSGAGQVVAVLTNTFPRPIPTPVKNLRPARETCEECHWPSKFYGAQLIQIPFYKLDENVSGEQISFLVKTGGGTPSLGENSGIHWHMIVNNKVEFIAEDEKNQNINYVKVTNKDGVEKEYFSKDFMDKKDLARKGKLHKMDCMDCHNRPTHIFTPPDRAIDFAIRSGAINKDIPFIKKVTYESVTKNYKNNDEASIQIKNFINDYYSKNYPHIYKEKNDEIEKIAQITVDIYNRTVFPYMNVDWSTYPENIGHKNWRGCFRCHDDSHISEDGKIISKDCTLCHTIPQRGAIEKLGAFPKISGEDWHPFKLEGKHLETNCFNCHKAGVITPTDCLVCHKDKKVKDSPMSDFSCKDCHLKPGIKNEVVQCSSCHSDLKELHKSDAHKEAECIDCHKEHRFTVDSRETCLNCHDDKKEHYGDKECRECHNFR
jgi:hypothetical protein